MNSVEKYRPTMGPDVLHSWAADAQDELEFLRAEVVRLGAEKEYLEKVRDIWRSELLRTISLITSVVKDS